MKLELGQLGGRRVRKSVAHRYRTDATILTHFELEVWNRHWKPLVTLAKRQYMKLGGEPSKTVGATT